MSDEQSTVQPSEDELTVLKNRADTLGLKYHPNIGVDVLRERVTKALAESKPSEEQPEASPALLKKIAMRRKKKDAEALVRVQVTCMDPKKKEWDGEIVTVGNSLVGSLKRYVPYNTEWHIPRMMLDNLKEAKCQVFFSVKGAQGNSSRRGKLINAYAIQELPQLTEEELKELAQRQAMANGTAEVA